MQQVKFISCRLRCFLSLLLFYGCGNADRNSFQSGNNYPLIHVDISRAEKIPDLKNVFADISFIPLETKESSIIAEITRVIYSNSRYYLLDKSAQSLKIFDTTGKFIRSIGAIGDGPGEYKKLNNFTIDKDTKHVLILDNGKQSIHEFDDNGNYIKSYKINLYARFIEISGDKYYYDIDHNISALSKNYNLIETDKSGKVIKRLFQFSPTLSFGSLSGFLISNGEGILYNSRFNDTIFQIDIESISAKYVFDLGPDKIPPDIQSSIERFAQEGNNYIYLFSQVAESKRYLLFSYLSKTIPYTAICPNITDNHIGTNSIIPKILDLPIGKPLGIKDSDHFISSIPVPRLMTVLNHNNKAFSKEVIEKDYPMLNKLLPSLKNSANPILTVFKFKDNIFGPGD